MAAGARGGRRGGARRRLRERERRARADEREKARERETGLRRDGKKEGNGIMIPRQPEGRLHDVRGARRRSQE